MRNNKFKVAGYLRLSVEDGDKEVSDSIVSQKNIIEEKIKSLGDKFELVDFYIDDGYTGLNTNRPNFQRMLNDIERKKVNCVITKDLSRLSRNNFEANYYIEFRDYSGNNISGADVRKVTSDLNAAVAGLDWKKEIAKFPTITVEIDKNGKRKWNWTPKAEQQVLKVVNEIYGSTDAHFLHKDPNSNTIVFTHGSFPETADTREFVKLVSSGGKRIDF